MRYWVVFLLIIILLGLPTGRVASAAFQPTPNWINFAAFSVAEMVISAAAYYMYKNSPAERLKGYPEELGLGEWYFGGYLGLSYLPPMDWKFTKDTTSQLLGPKALNIVYQPGLQGGLKFGRYFDFAPWLGVEVETNFSRNIIRGKHWQVSPQSPSFPTTLYYGADWFNVWSQQVNFVSRFGFLKDKEVPFGRLQPYGGIGPGFEIIYGKCDSAKNFAIETLAGIRYMCTDKISIFFEYKFSWQFAIEYQNVPSFNKTSAPFQYPGQDFTYTFDFPHHRFVMGVAYHFKNLYGN